MPKAGAGKKAQPRTLTPAEIAEAEAEAADNGSIIISFKRTSTGYNILFNNKRILATIGHRTEYQYTFGGLLDTGEALAMSTAAQHIGAQGTTLPLQGMLASLEKHPEYGYTFFGITPKNQEERGDILNPHNKDIRDVIEIWIPLCQYLFVYHIKLTQIKPEQTSGIGPDLNTAFKSVSGIPLNKKKGKTTTYYLTPEIIIDALILFVKKYGNPANNPNILIFTILRKILSNMPSEANNNNIDILRPDLIDLLTQGQGGGSRKLRSKRRKRKNSSKRKTNKRKRRRT